MASEDERLTLEGEPAAGRAERLSQSQERRAERQVRRRRDRQFMGVLLIFAVLFFGIGIVLARTVWRPAAAAGSDASPTPAPTSDPSGAQTTPLPEPAIPPDSSMAVADPSSAAATTDDVPAYDITTRDPIPFESKEAFVQHMKAWRHEDDKWLNARWDRYQKCVEQGDLKVDRVKQAFLATPRQLFCREQNLSRAYDHAYLDLGHNWGVTISGPHIVCRMTNALDPQPQHKCLEIGTGSGYQAAMLANLSDHVYSIEIIKPLAQETKELYEKLVAEGYDEYKNVHLKAADGYYGWEEYAPFDRIIVTCGIDHVPPDLNKQLAPDGIIDIPVGTYDSQKVLKITKKVEPDGEVELPEEDLYPGRTKAIQFVPFTTEGGGTHYR